MKDYNNINEKLKNDIQSLGLGISLVRDSIQAQTKIDPKTVSNQTKELLSLVYTNLAYLGKTYIPEQVDQEILDTKSALRNANNKIREMELELGKKVSPADITNFNKIFESEFRDAFNSVGLYAAPEVTFNSYSISVKVKFIKSLYEKSYYADTQEEIDQLDENNKKHFKKFKETFDFRDSDDCKNEKTIIISERNINAIKKMLMNANLDFEIDSIQTDRFGKKYDEITTIKFSQDIRNIFLKWDRSVYSGDE